MREEKIKANNTDIPVIITRAAVVGSGAAALNGAVHLKKLGVDDLLVVTEKIGSGTSANAGSDKQTYYRMDPSAAAGDSVRAVAETLYSGGAMHGDIALVEAALSTREFYHLVELGVPFPHDRHGVYGGFITDHDPRGRGTSAGPETSVMMVMKLTEEARRLGIEIMEGVVVIDIITVEEGSASTVAGLLAIRNGHPGPELVAIKADFVIFGTGGPGTLYRDSVYPHGQEGALGAVLRAGAVAQNLTESQFGIASTGVRWNLSGSYQQVLPRYISRAADGSDEQEFLAEGFPDFSTMLAAQFLKGYQWPFDVRKVEGFGSSLIDLLVYRERVLRGRRVFLDFSRNPSWKKEDFSWELLPPVAREYLEHCGAVGGTPLERLQRMNEPAYGFFLSRGADLSMKPLEIALCHQHVNGGLRGDIWWESSIGNFFPVGEANGSHGIYRPGGSALNAGQVGSLRAAQMIAYRAATGGTIDRDRFNAAAGGLAAERRALFGELLERKEILDLAGERRAIQERMSRAMGILRDPERIEQALAENAQARTLRKRMGVASPSSIGHYLRNGDLLTEERCFLESGRALLNRLDGSRGSFLVGRDEDILTGMAGKSLQVALCSDCCYGEVLELGLDREGRITTRFEPVRPIPENAGWFERDWTDFRTGRIYSSE